MHITHRFGKDELLHFAYQIFDADDNGWISHEEFILLLSDLHPSTNRGRTTRALREIDLLDDGKLRVEVTATGNGEDCYFLVFVGLFLKSTAYFLVFHGTDREIRD